MHLGSVSLSSCDSPRRHLPSPLWLWGGTSGSCTSFSEWSQDRGCLQTAAPVWSCGYGWCGLYRTTCCIQTTQTTPTPCNRQLQGWDKRELWFILIGLLCSFWNPPKKPKACFTKDSSTRTFSTETILNKSAQDPVYQIQNWSVGVSSSDILTFF